MSKDEWLRAVLVALEKVDDELCEIILSHFDYLDKSGDGSLSAEDLKSALSNNSEELKANRDAAKKYVIGGKDKEGHHGIRAGIRTH